MPIRVWIEPTDNCNFNCQGCPHKDMPAEKRGYMDMEVFKTIVRQCVEFKPSINLFMGGEPFLHPNIPDMIDFIHGYGMKVRLETNGSILRPDIMQAEPDVLSFSVDGYDEIAYEQNTGGDFKTILMNIKAMLAFKQTKPYVYITTIDFPNIQLSKDLYYYSFRRTLSDCEIDCFRTVKPHNFGGAVELMDIKSKNHRACPLLWSSLAVRWNGDIVACCMDFASTNILGNIKDITLKEAWNSSRLMNMRALHANNHTEHLQLCQNCSYPNSKTPMTDLIALLKEEIDI
jgi:radical SAM protein with 4Fe4S-binding SPASM domain